MIDYCNLLTDFHEAVYNKTGSELSLPNQAFVPGNLVAKLRADLITEECVEACDELLEEKGMKEALLKELCDVLYVVFGTAVTYNLPIERAFLEVHENNMLKIDTGTVGPNGKFIKSPKHPKVNLCIS